VTLAFDSKWEQVVAMTRMEGLHGAIRIALEKPNQLLSLVGGIGISRASTNFPAGALRFTAQTGQYATITSAAVAIGKHAIELPFELESYGSSGNRGLFVLTNKMNAHITSDTHQLVLNFWPAGTGGALKSGVFDIPDAAEFLSVKHTLRVRVDYTHVAAELDGDEIIRFAHDATSFASGNSILYVGDSSLSGATNTFLGYLGQVRWTSGDDRADETQHPMPRFPVLGAADPLREKVVFHSHFEPTQSGVPVDTKGVPCVLDGAASLSSGVSRYGVGCANFGAWAGGSVRAGPAPGFLFGDSDFLVEGCLIASTNNDDGAGLFAIKNGAGQAVLGVRIAAGSSYNTLAVHIGGTVLPFPGNYLSSGHFAVARQAEKLAVFFAGSRRAIIDIAGLALGGDGYFHWGWPTIFGATKLAPCGIDEGRITVGASRVSVDALSIPVPAEQFAEYGPRSLSGLVDDDDGNPVICTVRAYHTATGRLVSEGVTEPDGSFVLPVGDIDEHFWTAHLPGKKPLIEGDVIPVIIA